MGTETLHPQGIIRSLRLIVNMRWVAILSVAWIAALDSFLLRGLTFIIPDFYGLAVLIALVSFYNLVTILYIRIKQAHGDRGRNSLSFVLHLQLLLDILSLVWAIRLTSGAESPYLLLLLLYILAIGVIVSYHGALAYATLASALLGAVFLFEYANFLPHIHLLPAHSFDRYQDFVFIRRVWIYHSFSLYLGAFIVSRIGEQYRNALRSERSHRERAETLRLLANDMGSTLDQDRLLPLVLHKLRNIVPYDVSLILLMHGRVARVTAVEGFPHAGQYIGTEISPVQIPACVLAQEQLDLVVREETRRRDIWKVLNLPEIRHSICAPMVVRDKIIGYLLIGSRESVSEFDGASEFPIALIQTFASQAALAVENARLYEGMRSMALTDSLTGLYNRRYFYQVLEKELTRSRRYGRPLSLLICDLDHFKQYNDRFGHLAGDELLRQLSILLEQSLRKSDTVFRYGGEEFTMILPETDSSLAHVLAERLVQKVAQYTFPVGESAEMGKITISIGVATYPQHTCALEGLIQAADLALYSAKKTRNRVYDYAEIMPLT